MSQLSEIEAFIQVAQQSSFTTAAEILDLSRSRVSQLIQRLEERLEVKLLQRTTRSVSLTLEGEQFLVDCRHGLNLLTNAEANLKLFGQTLSGRVRINSVGGIFGEKFLSEALTDIASKNPELTIEVNYTSNMIDLEKNVVDLVLRIDDVPAENASATFLGNIYHTLCASPSFINQYGYPKTPEDLLKLPTVCGTPKQWRLEHRKTGKKQVISPTPVWRSGNTQAQLVATEAGIGISNLLSLVAESKLAEGKLIAVLPDWMVEKTSLWLMWNKSDEQPKRIQTVRDCLVQSLQTALARAN